MKVIATHTNADFDAIASMLGAFKLNPDAIPVLPNRVNRNVADFLALYRSVLPFVEWEDLNARDVSHIFITDTQSAPDIRGTTDQTQIIIIDHHERDHELQPNEHWRGDDVGAATTLTVEQIRENHIPLTTLEATLLALGIYADTGMLSYRNTTPRDAEAVAYLLRQGAVTDTVRRFLNYPLSDEQRELFDILLKSTHNTTIDGHSVIIARTHIDKAVDGINAVTEDLSDILDPDAIFVLVSMPKNIQLVARSRIDAINVGLIAEHFGGGGHPRAAAAGIYDSTLDETAEKLEHLLDILIQPTTLVSDLMSFKPQTVDADETIQSVASRLRLIGHEGYPVVSGKRIVGLLTMRDVNRALEHKLNPTIREVMQAGEIYLSPESTISELEQIISQSGWGQIPVVRQGDIIGIVTRTDLINHWATRHPKEPASVPTILPEQIKSVVGLATLELIQRVANKARAENLSVYLVGGFVRDMILNRENFDIDFVVEGDAIAFARQLSTKYGGRIHAHQPFGTANWFLDEVEPNLPDHIDFATARSELYEHPTALPTVYGSGIKLDLRRRDFTINTLALQLSPQAAQWHLLDYYGGQADLDQQVIRVLHSLSFVDDPTRILRAVRFSIRLNFVIEHRTAELIQTALPMLKRITGERVRNELTLLLQEVNFVQGFNTLADLSILPAIHPDFTPDLSFLHEATPEDSIDTRWALIFAGLQPSDISDITHRLLFNQQIAEYFEATANLIHSFADEATQMRPSQITAYLNRLPEAAIELSARIHPDESTRQLLKTYLSKWRTMKPVTTGHDLKAHGLEPGPQYARILNTLRNGWIDGDIMTTDDEIQRLNQLLEESQS